MRDKWSMEPNDIMRIPWLEEESADGSLIGFVDDVKFTSLRQGVSELGFVINEPSLMLYSFIRVKAGSDIVGVVDHIRLAWTLPILVRWNFMMRFSIIYIIRNGI